MLTTPAWIMIGMSRTVPGILSYDDDRLRFASGEELVFDAAPKDIQEVKWPKIYMGSGCKLAIDGESYRVTFVKPNGAPDITDKLLGDAGGVLGAAGSVADLKEAMGSFGDIKKGRAAGKAWKELLAGVTA